MAELARGRGVPAEAILIEDQARNTSENIRFSYALLERSLGLASLRSVMLLTIHYHLRRAFLAARSRFPPEIGLLWACYASLYYTADNWSEVERGRRDVMAEIQKIKSYYGLTLSDLLRLGE